MRWWPWHVHPSTGGHEARQQAAEALHAAESQREEVQAVAERLRLSRESNHFGASIAAAMREKQP